jgi:1-deoxy-D-xylulose-5-phosphate reductoisomerase
MKVISILGSTGSIGRSTLDVIRLHRDSFKIFALSCNKNINLLIKQAIEFDPEYLVCSSELDAQKLKDSLSSKIKSKIIFSNESNNFIASHDDVTHVVAAISGSAGLESTYHAAKSNKVILLANKESMVVAGPIIMGLIKKNNSSIIPIDSEHNAIYQALQGLPNKKKFLKRIILTASGGPFLNTPLKDIANVNVDDALKHPNWKMGKKITIDSATMMNKCLEVIEASFLFELNKKQIDVLIHPQSIIHSLVEYVDGSYLTQLGSPDMRIPISYALGFPGRLKSGALFLDLTDKNLVFLKPDNKKFPCLNLAYEVLESGHNYCIALNAANEIAVDAFLEKKIKFSDIFRINFKILSLINTLKLSSIEEVIDYDLEIRSKTKELVDK